MRIKSIYIASFGGLKNKKIELSRGFNVIYGENENGKTTVMTFIKMMFYGSGRGSAQISKDMRKKYTPWSGEAMAGSIDFELNNKNYRLEREFRKSDSTDKITLLDLDLGTREAVSNDIGVKLLGLSSAAFERSVFIGQFGAMESDPAAEGEINAKLSNIVTSGDESVSFNTVSERLLKAKNALISKSGRAGEYAKTVKQIEELEQKLISSQKIREDYARFCDRVNEFKAEMADDVKKATELKKRIDTEQDVRNAQKLREMLELKKALDELNDELKLSDGGFADEMFVKKLDFCLNKIDAANRECVSKQNEAERLKESIALAENQSGNATPEKAEELRQRVTEKQNEVSLLQEKLDGTEVKIKQALNNEEKIKNSKRAVSLPLLILGIALILGGIAGYFFIGNVALTVSALGALLGALSFVFKGKDKNKIAEFYTSLNLLKTEQTELSLKLSGVNAELSGIEARYEAIASALNTSAAMLERQRELLKESLSEIEKLREQIKAQEETLFDLFLRYKSADSTEQIIKEKDNISRLADRQKEIKNRLNYIARDVGNISYEEADKKLNNLDLSLEESVDFDSLKAEYEELINRLAAKKEELAVARSTAENRLNSAENPETLNRQISELREKALSQENFCKRAEIAIDVLTQSFAELRREYGSALETKAGEIFKGLTDGQYESMQISRAFDISATKKDIFGGKEIGFLSSGTADQAYLSLRLALSSLIFEGAELLPILLDDALAQYDDKRADIALKYLAEYSLNSQAILFTCHRSFYSSANELGANCKEFN